MPPRKFTGAEAVVRLPGAWNARIVDTHVAPKLSLLTECRAKLTPPLPDYFISMVLNGGLRLKLADRTRIAVLNFIRHLDIAIQEYNSGAAALSDYVSALPNTPILVYLRALGSLGISVNNLYIADLMWKILSKDDEHTSPLDEPFDRLRKINNELKHYNENLLDAEAKGGPMLVAPVWITNAGLESAKGVSLSFAKYLEMLEGDANNARVLSEEIPKEIIERGKGMPKDLTAKS